MASTLSDTHGIDRVTDKGHGTAALGPSDSTDSGSDITGAQGVVEGDVLGLDHGTNEDLETHSRSAGPDIGDADLDSDSDSVGTGEHVTAGRDLQVPTNADILPDHVEVIPDAGLDDSETNSRKDGA